MIIQVGGTIKMFSVTIMANERRCWKRCEMSQRQGATLLVGVWNISRYISVDHCDISSDSQRVHGVGLLGLEGNASPAAKVCQYSARRKLCFRAAHKSVQKLCSLDKTSSQRGGKHSRTLFSSNCDFIQLIHQAFSVTASSDVLPTGV